MGINKIDISEKTISLELRENHQLCPEKLIKYINSDFKKIRVRNKRLLFEIGPKKTKEKIKELFVILRELRRLYLNS
jgi:transcription-repair coupling factor (superfamily II helicase)